LSKHKLILPIAASIAWLLLVFLPWQALFGEFLAGRFLLGFLLFLIPGTLTCFLISAVDLNWKRALLGGFVFSILGTGILGLLARLFQLNFVIIRTGFALWGAAVVFLFLRRDIRLDLAPARLSWWETAVLLVAAGGAVFFISLARPPLIHDDAFTYNALVYYYQNADRLDFVFPEALNRLEIPRFWIAYWPLVEALISELSQVDGLIITGCLLPPALAGLSFLGVYALGRTLGLPRAAAALAVLAQGLSLMRLTRFNQPGNLFFQRLTEDKVVAAFVISLVLFMFAVEYFEDPRRRRLMIVGLAALAMVFTHPIQFGMACMVIGVYGLPALLRQEVRWKYAALIAVLAAVVLIPYSFRFGGGEYQQSLSFSLEDVAENDESARFGVRRVDVVEGTRFYGISRYLTTGFPYEIGLAAAALSLLFFRRHILARFVLAAFLVLGVSMFPYTGWLVGFFTTPFQLWRLTWLMPFGLAFSLLVWTGLDLIRRIAILQARTEWVQAATYLTAALVLAAGLVYLRPWAVGNLPPANRNLIDIYSNYVSMGRYMNAMAADHPGIIGGPDAVTNSIIPSLTLKFDPLVFRVESGGEQTRLWRSLLAEGLKPEERYAALRGYRVEYMLVRGDPDWMAQLLSAYPGRIALIFADRRFKLYRLD